MIKTNEIRRDNLLKHKGDLIKVIAIDQFDYVWWDLSENTCPRICDMVEFFDPIPLTDEWLIKFGSIKNCNLFEFSEQIQQSCLGDKGKNCPSVFFNKRLDRWMDPQTRVCFDYVHQLQNLFYCLTGNELNIK